MDPSTVKILKAAGLSFGARLKLNPPIATAQDLWDASNDLDDEDLAMRVWLLTEASWDPGGWSVMEWSRLPTMLRSDLSQAFERVADHLLRSILA